MNSSSKSRQHGITLVGLIFVLAVVGMVGILGLKVVPTALEFMAVKKAMTAAKAAGNTPTEIRSSFDKQANTGYIDSVSGKDLEFSKDGDQTEISIAYQKKIPLFGPASLLIDYEATTASGARKKAAF